MQLHETEAVTGGVIPVAFQEVGPQEVETSLCMQEATVQQHSAGVPKFTFDINCPPIDSQQNLLNVNADVSAVRDSELGCTKVIHLEFTLLDNTPVKWHHHIIPPGWYVKVKVHIMMLLQQGVIR